MKLRNLAAFFFAATALVLVSCKPEQSELNLDQITEKANICGKIVYSTGTNMNGSELTIVQTKPAANKVVFAEIEYSSLDDDAIGKKIYQTITDSAGNWRFELPATAKGLQNVVVRSQDFTDYYTSYKKVSGTTPEFKTELKSYSYEHTVATTLYPGSVYYAETQACEPKDLEMEAMEETITLTGKVLFAKETGFRRGTFAPIAGATIEFTAEYYDIDEIFQTATTTADDGTYTITLPLYSYREGFEYLKYQVRRMPAQYTHYTSIDETEVINGVYESAGYYWTDKQNIVEGINYVLDTEYIMFDPTYNEFGNQLKAPKTWTQNLAEWILIQYFPNEETMDVTGKYLLGYETAYKEVGYSNKLGEAFIHFEVNDEPYNVYVSAEATGKFSLKLPKSAINVQCYHLPGTFQFNHFNNQDEKAVIDGYYWLYQSPDNYTKQNLGTWYFAFNPVNDSEAQDWDASMWANYKDYEK